MHRQHGRAGSRGHSAAIDLAHSGTYYPSGQIFSFFLPSLGSQAFLGNTKRLISVQTRRGKSREETQTVYKPFHLSQGVQQVATLNRLRVLSL